MLGANLSSSVRTYLFCIWLFRESSRQVGSGKWMKRHTAMSAGKHLVVRRKCVRWLRQTGPTSILRSLPFNRTPSAILGLGALRTAGENVDNGAPNIEADSKFSQARKIDEILTPGEGGTITFQARTTPKHIEDSLYAFVSRRFASQYA